MRKKISKLVILTYFVSVLVFSFQMMGNVESKTDNSKDFHVTATDLGVMCITTAYPTMGIQLADSRDNDIESEENQNQDVQTIESINTAVEKLETETIGEPRVLIVHTHATESYLPSSEGNFHRKEEENTVRDVGNVIQTTLESQGIGVVHDKTLHDYPSYNSSYSRSYDTVSAILSKYPSIECVIDLHRDAVSGDAPAQTISIGGKTCAKYSYVIGNSASTYSQNKDFVSRLNGIASSKYSGFTGAVIERGYPYNQDLSSKYLLVEIGFNRNQIEDCRNTAHIFGNILAEGLKR